MASATFAVLFTFCGFKFGTSQAVSDFLQTYIQRREASFGRENELCKNLIFASFPATDQSELILKFASKHSLKTFVLNSQIEHANQTGISNRISFDKLQTSEEIISSFATLGLLKFVRHCSLIFLSSGSESAEIIKFLVLKNLARPHKDYFIFQDFGKKGNTPNNVFLQEIRYKYFIVESRTEVDDACVTTNEQSGEVSSLFGTRCATILNGRHVNVVSVSGTPWIKLDSSSSSFANDGSGIYLKLLTDSARLFNFTFEVHYAKDGGSSGFMRNGRWYGTVGEVYNRDADIGLGCGITSHRDWAIDNGIPFEDISRVFFIRISNPELNWEAILAPFQSSVWFLILAMVGLLIPIYFVALSWEYSKQTETPLSQTCSNTRLLSVVTSTVGMLFEQESGDRTRVGMRIKFLLSLWMFFCLVIGTGYKSRLTYFLTFRQPPELPTTHAALLEQDYILFFRYYGGVAYKAAQDSSDQVQHEIVRRAVLVNSSTECIVAAILHEKSACLDWDEHGSFASYTNATFHARQTKDLIVRAKDSVLDGLWIAWVYRNKSPLIETFDTYLAATFASGIYSKWVAEDWADSKSNGAKWLNSNPNLPENRKIVDIVGKYSSAILALNFASLQGIFGCTIYGSIMALVFFCFEIVVGKRICTKCTTVFGILKKY